jgi:hypothetical protein
MDNGSSPSSNKHEPNPARLPIAIGIDDKDIRFDIFTLCDAAIDAGGRLSLVGTYEEIGSSAFPFVLPQLTIAVRMRIAPAEGTRHRFRMALVDPDGTNLSHGIESGFELLPRRNDRAASYNLIVNIQNQQFDEPGCYAIDFYLNNKFEGRLPFYVEHAGGLT